MQVKEAMSSNVKIANPDQSIRAVARLMSELDCGCLPVGEDGRLVGMITDRDIAVRAVAEGMSLKTPIREIMSLEVKYCFSDAEPGELGPRRVSKKELHDDFAEGWTIESIEPTRAEVRPDFKGLQFSEGWPRAWFVVVRRVSSSTSGSGSSLVSPRAIRTRSSWSFSLSGRVAMLVGCSMTAGPPLSGSMSSSPSHMRSSSRPSRSQRLR